MVRLKLGMMPLKHVEFCVACPIGSSKAQWYYTEVKNENHKDESLERLKLMLGSAHCEALNRALK